MFNRAEFLQALENDMTSIQRADMWGMVGYLLLMGPCSRGTLRQAFWPIQGAFNFNLHWLVKHHAVLLSPDKWEGEPLVKVHPDLFQTVENVNRPKMVKTP